MFQQTVSKEPTASKSRLVSFEMNIKIISKSGKQFMRLLWDLKKIMNRSNYVLFICESIALLVIFLVVSIFTLKSTMPLFPSICYLAIILLLNLTVLNFFYYDIRIKKRHLIDANHIRVFLILAFFSIGSVTAYKYYEEFKLNQSSKIGHTIALRAWACEVDFRDIKIHYLSSKNTWEDVPGSVFYNRDNWHGPLWQAKGLGKVEDGEIFDPEPSKKTLNLKNAGIVLKPSLIDQGKGSRNIQITAKITLKNIDSGLLKLQPDDENKKFYGIQFCMDLPIEKYYNEKPDFYNALEFFFEDFTWTKLRNPMLNLDDFSGNNLKNNQNNRDIKEISDKVLNIPGKKIPLNKEFILSAKILNGNMILTIINDDNNFHKVLYDGKITL